MEKIDSFKVNHLSLYPGVYVSRKDTTPSGDVITTFDVRLTAPNREPACDAAALHAMEHLAATYLRNHSVWRDRIVYWGPMGCLTGNYLIVAGDYKSADIVPLLLETFRFIARFDGEIPGATPRDCGNYSFMNLAEARRIADRFVAVLENITPDRMHYPD
ncbi:MAG: S-ribosylhomocysteine lyase [Muribaculaceae bacterium]|nr:S-ribosylhomocysteine lyase [Muribaculaceae bacterium]